MAGFISISGQTEQGQSKTFARQSATLQDITDAKKFLDEFKGGESVSASEGGSGTDKPGPA